MSWISTRRMGTDHLARGNHRRRPVRFRPEGSGTALEALERRDVPAIVATSYYPQNFVKAGNQYVTAVIGENLATHEITATFTLDTAPGHAPDGYTANVGLALYSTLFPDFGTPYQT